MRLLKGGLLALLVLVAGLIVLISHESAISLKPAQTKQKIYYQNRAVVLLYHNLAFPESGTTITRERLAAHFALLNDRGFNVVSLDQVVGFVEGKNDLPVNAVAITIDDGHFTNYTVAYPLLKARHWPATVFLPVANVGRMEGQRASSHWLNWKQIKEMQHYNIAFCNHTYNGHFFTPDISGNMLPWLMAVLPSENQSDHKQRIRDDLQLAQRILEYQLGRPCQHFAAPFGLYDTVVVDELRQLGIRYMWSTDHWPITRESQLSRLGRISVGIGGTSPDELFEQIIETAAHNDKGN